jgi:hypothetical protein
MNSPELHVVQLAQPSSNVAFPEQVMFVLYWCSWHEPTLQAVHPQTILLVVEFQWLDMYLPCGQEGHSMHLSLKVVPSHSC